MPIECRFEVGEISKDRFHEIDYQVMRHVFDIQNELGRLCHESIYQAELLYRCSIDGLSVLEEGEVVVSFETFRKSYFLDALVNQGALYEFKAVEVLNGPHESQLLNYLFLSGLREGKLINFSSPSVQHRFVSTNIRPATRYAFTINDSSWDSHLSSSENLRGIIQNLLNEWGAFLDVNLYREAVFHFLGGEDELLVPIDISVNGRLIGHQKMHLLDEKTGIHISSTIQNIKQYRKQLIRMLSHTNLEQMQWINFCRSEIEFITLKK